MTIDSIPTGTIVVGIDGSPSSDRAIEWAAKEAAHEHRPLTIVHGTPAAAKAWLTAPGYGTGSLIDDVREGAEQLLAEARTSAEKVAPAIEITTVFEFEDPRQVLVELSHHATAIVVGSRGRGPVSSLLLGSVGIGVVRHAACPVIVLRPPGEELRGGVVVGVDATDGSLAALDFAYRHAAQAGVALKVLHSWMPGALTKAERAMEEQDEKQRRHLVSRSVSELALKYPDVSHRILFTRLSAAEALVLAAEGADLLVVGRRRHEPVLGTLAGSVALAVVEHANTTVAVVPAL